ncbi:CdaR family protein [uncultured Anaerofustis sp.]|uniref:CdaR family protein n=1 Tax=uncultured Anaerofustis sp. TaxID=904996 RepID=UPI0025CC1D17|nr:CdaR family protein [uncultured Anaerofustis sp.]
MDKNNSKIMTLLISFLLALLLWAYATSDGDNMAYSRIEDIPIAITNTNNLDQNDFVVKLSKEKIESIKVYGKGSLVKSMNNQNIHASVDLKDISTEGTYTLNINIKGIPSDVTVVDQSPNVVKVTVDKMGNKDISIPLIKQTGELKKGYSVLSLSSSVDSVHISGPSNSVDKVKAIVGTVDVYNRSEDFTSNVNLYAVDENGKKIKDVDLSPKTTSVNVNIGRTKEVDINVKTKGKSKDGYKITSITPNKTKITISGPEDVLNSIETVNTEVLDLSEITSSIDKKLDLDLPEGVHVVDSKDTVDVSVSVDRDKQKTIYITSFTFDNLSEGLSAEVIDDKVGVLLSGDNALLNEISEKNLVGSLDLSGLTEGTHSVAIKISTQGIPDGVKIQSVSKNSVSVKITKGQIK